MVRTVPEPFTSMDPPSRTIPGMKHSILRSSFIRQGILVSLINPGYFSPQALKVQATIAILSIPLFSLRDITNVGP